MASIDTQQTPPELAALDAELPGLLKTLEAEAVPAGDPMGIASAVSASASTHDLPTS